MSTTTPNSPSKSQRLASIPIIKLTRNPSTDALPETPKFDEHDSNSDDDYQLAGDSKNDSEPTTSPTSPSITIKASTSTFHTSRERKDAAAQSIDTPGEPTPVSNRAPVRRKDSPPTAETHVDPLSLHILKRTGTTSQLPGKMLYREGESRMESSEPTNPVNPSISPSAQTRRAELVPQNKEKKKGVSFLSRFIPGGAKKKESVSDDDDDESVAGDQRTEGLDAAVFSQPIGFTPQFPPPPKYIRVRSHNKTNRDFNRMFLAQELDKRPVYEEDNIRRRSAGAAGPNGSSTSLAMPRHKSGAIWAMQFSKDGRYLAVAGQDKVVTVWEVLSSQDDRTAHERDEDAGNHGSGTPYASGRGVRVNTPVFRTEPLREYVGHTADVLDLSWSKNNFLLSSSMDKTVRLWHVSRKECLCAFQHSDFVTSIVFHPKDDRFFLAGSLDSKLRLWSIPDKSVAFSVELPDLITAVAFTPDGRLAIAGCLSGLCLFYETEGLRYHTQVHVRSSHGRNAKGSKITGIETMMFPPDDPNGETKLLITSNDSRIRLYNLRDKSLETKFRGNENVCSQIHATFSDDATYVISGSEDRKVYIWNVSAGTIDKKAKRPLEYFEAHPAIVTVAVMAPSKTRQLLGASGDPIYDLCNPPPVTLISRSESFASSKNGRGASTPTPPESGVKDPAVKQKLAEESPAYLSRAKHNDGNIIVTADYLGRIKVFRQDCAWLKRKNESWETGSTFSKKIGTGLFSGGRDRRGSVSNQQNSPDRILSWRNSIASNHSQDTNSLRGVGRRGSMGDDKTNGSTSPPKTDTASQASSRSSIGAGIIKPSKISVNDEMMSSRPSRRPRADSLASTIGSSDPATKPSSIVKVDASNDIVNKSVAQQQSENPLYIQETGQSMAFYNLDQAPATEAGYLRPGGKDRRASLISSEGSAEEGYSSESESEALKCNYCGSTEFRAKKSRTGEAILVCTKCKKPN